VPTSFRIALCILLLTGSNYLRAQESQPARLDLSATYIEGRSLKADTSQNFWTQGGSIELGANVGRGWGIAANVTGIHAGSIGTSGLPLSQVTATFGPRYRWHADHRLSLYGEGLIGEANGFRSIFPVRSQRPIVWLHRLAAAWITEFLVVSPFGCSMRRGRGRNCRTAQTMCRTVFSSAPVSCCASHTNNCECLNSWTMDHKFQNRPVRPTIYFNLALSKIRFQGI